tara:strand:+ start:137 stop:481 length:345 start_codon:yes stop_codon:yes gene_type:complete
MIIIYHNNRCSKSRQCLGIIKKSKLDYKVIEYLKEELSLTEIRKIVYRLDAALIDIVRTDEKVIKGLKINFTNKESIVNLISNYKICMQRPIVYVKKKYVICRPPEKILKYIKE